MATIASLVIEMMADPAGVRTGLDKAAGYVRQYAKTADQTLKGILADPAGFEEKAVLAAEQILAGLEQSFAQNAGAVREQLARGVIDKAEFAKAGTQSAQAFNAALLASLAKLRSSGLATTESVGILQGGLKTQGIVAAEQAAGKLATNANAGAAGLSRIRQGMLSLLASLTGTVPVLDRMGGTLAAYSFGGGIVLAVVAGLAAIAYAWKKVHEETDAARKAMEEYAKTDDAFRARSAGTSATFKAFEGVPGGRTDLVGIVGQTKAIDDLTRAAQGYQNALRAGFTFAGQGSSTAAYKAIAAVREQLAQGTLTSDQFRVKLGELARSFPDWAKQIGQTAQLGFEYRAAQDSLAKLIATEEHRTAIEAATRLKGPTPEIATELGRANARLAAFGSGGKAAVDALDDTYTATDKATEAWDKYVVTTDGARFATLTFSDALRRHNPVAVQAYESSLRIAEAARQLAKDMKDVPVRDYTKAVSDLIGLAKLQREANQPIYDTIAAIYTKYLDLANASAAADAANPWSETAIQLRKARLELDAYIASLTKVSGAPLGEVPNVTRIALPFDVGGRQTVGGVTTGGATPARLPPGPSVDQARFRAVVSTVEDDLRGLGSSLKSLAGSTFFGVLRSIAGQLNPFAQVISAIATAAKPLMPVMLQLANIVARTLGPVFEAFAPVLQALLPLIDAIFRVLSPILQALAPLFQAFIPLLTALFPIFKLVAIAATYIGQAFALAASLVLRAVGNIIVGFGTIIKALAEAIDKLPFVSAKGAIKFAQGIIDFGKGMVQSADDFAKTADALGKARGEIEGITVDDAQTKIDSLGNAAQDAAGSLANVPTGYKIALARFNATAAIQTPAPSGPAIGALPPIRGELPRPTPTPPAPAGTPGGPPSSGGGGQTAASMNFQPGAIIIQGATLTPAQMFDGIVREGQRRARAKLGDPTQWAQVQD